MRLGRDARVWLWAVGVAVTCLGLGSVATAENTAEKSPVRYPYDPACAWGRLADGHGMLIRCLEPGEASVLLESSLHANPPRSAEAPPREVPPREAPPSAAPAKPAPAVNAKPPAAGSAPQQLIVSEVGPAVADSGELPLAANKLGAPKDRYIDCVRNNGGLSRDTGKVVVRFLVRERGRAEGVSVKSHSGMSQAAAECIADVVDRRYVGYPAAPIVGATIPIELSIRR